MNDPLMVEKVSMTASSFVIQNDCAGFVSLWTFVTNTYNKPFLGIKITQPAEIVIIIIIIIVIKSTVILICRSCINNVFTFKI